MVRSRRGGRKETRGRKKGIKDAAFAEKLVWIQRIQDTKWNGRGETINHKKLVEKNKMGLVFYFLF